MENKNSFGKIVYFLHQTHKQIRQVTDALKSTLTEYSTVQYRGEKHKRMRSGGSLEPPGSVFACRGLTARVLVPHHLLVVQGRIELTVHTWVGLAVQGLSVQSRIGLAKES
jgi:hypothetical protein